MADSAESRWWIGGIWAAALATFAMGAALVAVPGIDLWVARQFYDPDLGFAASHQEPYATVRQALKVPVALLAAAGAMSLANRALDGRYLFGLERKAMTFLVAMAALRPGLLSESVFKSHWGRARPVHLVELGGTKLYTPPLVIADQCARNCSFISTEASYGYAFVALAFLQRGARRRRALSALGLGYGSAVGALRIIQGGHFLSDIFFSGVFMAALAWLLHRLIVEHDAVALALARLGLARFAAGPPRPRARPDLGS